MLQVLFEFFDILPVDYGWRLAVMTVLVNLRLRPTVIFTRFVKLIGLNL